MQIHEQSMPRAAIDCDSGEQLGAIAGDMIADLRRAWDDNRFPARLAVYTRPKLLCVDEVGYLP